jgi:prevent-host-death family protein
MPIISSRLRSGVGTGSVYGRPPAGTPSIAIRSFSWDDPPSLCAHGREQYDGLTFVGVREFKENLTGYLGKGEEMVVTRHGKPIARVVPVEKGSPEDLLLEIGMVLKDAGVTREKALAALKAAGKVVYG